MGISHFPAIKLWIAMITGIEIAEGQIRLVRWSKDLDDPAHRVLETQDLTGIFAGLDS